MVTGLVVTLFAVTVTFVPVVALNETLLEPEAHVTELPSGFTMADNVSVLPFSRLIASPSA